MRVILSHQHRSENEWRDDDEVWKKDFLEEEYN